MAAVGRLKCLSTMKSMWMGHVASQWRPRLPKINIGRLPKILVDDIKMKACKNWQQIADNRLEWKRLKDAYVQQWTYMGSELTCEANMGC